VWILRFRRDKGRVVLNNEAVSSIWMPVERERVPRIDLISRADIERSIFGSERKSKHYRYNSYKKRFETVTHQVGLSKKEWQDDLKSEEQFERRIRKQYQQYIDECHRVAMEARAELMAPFRPDPFEGRCLFLFHDERTAGGHA
jgi:predicted Holliday junction resolvase-like endonuclease